LAEENAPRDALMERRMAEIREIMAHQPQMKDPATQAIAFLGASVEQVARDINRLKRMIFLVIAALQNGGKFDDEVLVGRLLDDMGFQRAAKPADTEGRDDGN
jgi:DNA-binding transcriptional MerR regulator